MAYPLSGRFALRDAARLLGKSIRTIQGWAYRPNGPIRPTKIGGSLRVKAEDIALALFGEG
ncbi:MAG: helix-turn-helix domain-containing protein [Alphaproteobacteria bacterium]|nr:helix-turn-helix domain-containing protein [Alphaproteobacteria bacterium]